MTAPSPTLFPYEALSLQQICIQPVNGEAIKTFSGALTILSRIFACEEINLYIVMPYETGEMLKLVERANICDSGYIEPVLGYSISMGLDAESGKYDTLDSMSARIMEDELLNRLRFSRDEIAKSNALKDLARRMGLAGERQTVEAEGLPLNCKSFPTQPVNSEQDKKTASAKPESKPRKRETFTQEAAAKAIGCSTSCIKKWERGEHTPADYPGRGDLVALQMFAARYKAQRAANRTARNMRRASTGHDIDGYGEVYETDT